MPTFLALTGHCEHALSGHSGTVRALAVVTAGQLASGSDDRSIKIWVCAAVLVFCLALQFRVIPCHVSNVPDGSCEAVVMIHVMQTMCGHVLWCMKPWHAHQLSLVTFNSVEVCFCATQPGATSPIHVGCDCAASTSTSS